MTIENLYGVPDKFNFFNEIYPASRFNYTVITDVFVLYEYRKSYYLMNTRTNKFFKIQLNAFDKQLCTHKNTKQIDAYLLFSNIQDNFFNFR